MAPPGPPGTPEAAFAAGRRADAATIADALARVGTANLSDACHHRPGLRGIVCRTPGLRMAGPAVTVRTAPGDWNRAVLAIDQTPPGGVLAIDAGGVPPAVWGGLATLTAKRAGLAGVVVYGAIRDSREATAMGLPLFSAQVCPDAGDPKGYGEIGARIALAGQTVEPGDWLVGDDDGVLVLPRAQAVEYVNRALDVVESESRLRAEIERGASLASVARLDKWDRWG